MTGLVEKLPHTKSIIYHLTLNPSPEGEGLTISSTC